MFWMFIDPAVVAGGPVSFAGAKGHHLARVLRVRAGERGVAVAGGREYDLEVVAVHAERVTARVLGDRPARGEPGRAVTVLQAVLPNPDFDAVIEAGTAVGALRFLAVEADRSVARPAPARLSRWQAIAESAAEQSHRGRVPEVAGPMSLGQAVDQAAGSRLLLLDPGAPTPLDPTVDGAAACAIAVGPEGGWSDSERALLRERGGVPVNLGPRILRARLAPVVATAILVQQR
jgi:16S rRNA (uracil1498-N3)-methyltransferase